MSAAEPTLVDWLDRAAEHPADGEPHAGLRFVDRRESATFFSWSTLRDRARRLASGLAELGIAHGDRVGLVFPTTPEFFDALFGCQLLGAVPVPLYPPVRLGRLDEYHQRTAAMLDAASVQLVLADARVRRLLGATIEQAKTPLGCRVPGSLPAADAGGSLSAHVEPADLALVQFSSGTTVAPKPVALSHRAIVAQVEALNSFWPDDGEVHHTGVSWLPLYHDMGLIGCIFPALERPSVQTLIGPEVFVAKPALWLRAISTYRATISVAPNFAYALCVDRIRDDQLEGVDLSTWQVALNGAEAVSPGVLRAFQERFARWGFRPEALTPVYGLSEATLAVSFSRLDAPFRAERFDREALARGLARRAPAGRELIGVGRPLPGYALRVVDEAGVEVDPGRIGRVEVRGPSIMDGYLGRPEATAAVLSADGWLDTGDLGFLVPVDDADTGFDLFLVGRAKDVLILRGRNHDPAEVEHAIDAVVGVRKGCSVAVGHLPEDADGEHLLLFVEHAREIAAADLDTLGARCAEAVLGAAGLRVARVIVVAPGTLPRTSSGKLRRSETLRRHLDDSLDPPKAVTPVRLAAELVRSTLAHARARARGPG